MHICDSLCRDELKQNTQTQTIQNFKWQFIIKNNVLPAWLLGCLLHQLSLVATRRTINPGCTGTPSPQPRTLPSIHWLGTCRYHSQVPDPQTTALWQGQKGAVKVAPVEATSDMPHCELWGQVCMTRHPALSWGAQSCTSCFLKWDCQTKLVHWLILPPGDIIWLKKYISNAPCRRLKPIWVYLSLEFNWQSQVLMVWPYFAVNTWQ